MRRLFQGTCSRGVLHRDLKPSNVLVDRTGMPHVLDFGLAKFGDLEELKDGGEGLSKSAEIFGTPAYAAPEQLRGNQARLDMRADVYSLGVMLYEMLGGSSPYGEWNGINDLLRRVGQVRPRPLSLLDSRVGPDLDTILTRAMAPAMEHRYASVRELADDIRCYLEGKQISALPTSSWILFSNMVRNNRLTSAMALGLVVVTALFGWQVLRMGRDAASQNLLYREQGKLLEAEIQRNAELLSFIPDCLPSNQQLPEVFNQKGVLPERPQVRASANPYLDSNAGKAGVGPLTGEQEDSLLKRLKARD